MSMYDDFDFPSEDVFAMNFKKAKRKKVKTPKHDDVSDKDTIEVDEYLDDNDF